MAKGKKSRVSKPGLPPGTLVHVGEKKAGEVKLTLVSYDENQMVHEACDAKKILAHKPSLGVTWINVDGLHKTDEIEQIGRHFHLHPLTLEDIVNSEQRPKVENYDDYLFVVLKIAFYDNAAQQLEMEQISLVLMAGTLLSFQEKETGIFNPVIERLHNAHAKFGKLGSDYLAYALIDTLVDNYFVALEQIGERIDVFQDEVMANPNTRVLANINLLKKQMIVLRRTVLQLRELMANLERNSSVLIQPETKVFLRDVYDHIVQIAEHTDTLREFVANMMELYLTSVNYRMNEIMKVLTVIATIFIPLTFICSVYGMNFRYMPELEWNWGYPAILVLMLIMGGGMLVYFRVKRWI